MKLNLRGKTALVTGGSRGIGSAICRDLAEEGVNIGVNYNRSAVEAERLAGELRDGSGIRAAALKGDLANEQEIINLIAALEAEVGEIDNVVSQAAFLGSTSGHLPYDSSKGAVVSMTRAIAREVAPDGINVNAVAPGMVKTGMVKKLLDAKLEFYLSRIPLKRIAEPEEIASIVTFLASDAASFMTGTTLDATGGLMMR